MKYVGNIIREHSSPVELKYTVDTSEQFRPNVKIKSYNDFFVSFGQELKIVNSYIKPLSNDYKGDNHNLYFNYLSKILLSNNYYNISLNSSFPNLSFGNSNFQYTVDFTIVPYGVKLSTYSNMFSIILSESFKLYSNNDSVPFTTPIHFENCSCNWYNCENSYLITSYSVNYFIEDLMNGTLIIVPLPTGILVINSHNSTNSIFNFETSYNFAIAVFKDIFACNVMVCESFNSSPAYTQKIKDLPKYYLDFLFSKSSSLSFEIYNIFDDGFAGFISYDRLGTQFTDSIIGFEDITVFNIVNSIFKEHFPNEKCMYLYNRYISINEDKRHLSFRFTLRTSVGSNNKESSIITDFQNVSLSDKCYSISLQLLLTETGIYFSIIKCDFNQLRVFPFVPNNSSDMFYAFGEHPMLKELECEELLLSNYKRDKQKTLDRAI